MGRTILSSGVAIGLGFVVAGACQVPSTLGLPCTDDTHCDSGQHCGMEVCRADPRPPTMGTSTGPIDLSTTGDMGATSTTDGGDTTTDTGGETTVAVDGSSDSSSSTGSACGIGSCIDVDLLVVLDNSPSMFQWILPLANSLPTLIAKYSNTFEQVCTFHLGMVNANELNEDNPKGCQGLGSLVHRGKECGGGDGVRPWWSDEDGEASDVLDELRCTIINQGTGGDENEMMLGALMGALDPATNAEGACNEGFRRPDANLFVLYVSDEDDPTPTGEIDNLAEQFADWVDPNRVAFVSVVADDADECPWEEVGTDSDGSGAQLPTGLNGFLALTGIPFDQQAVVDICEMNAYSFDNAFVSIAHSCDVL